MLVELLACFSTEELLRESDVFPRTGGLNHCCSTHVCSDLRGGEITQAGFFFCCFAGVYAHASLWVLHSWLKPTPFVFAESSPGGLQRTAVPVCVLGGGRTERCLEQHPFLGHHTNTLGTDLRMHESAVRGALT